MIHSDKFTARLVQAVSNVYQEGKKDVAEDIRLHLIRNDFMITGGDSRILQVEINTVSVGFAGMIERLSVLHKSNLRQFYPQIQFELPFNNPCTSFAKAIADAVSLNNSKWNRAGATVLFVVEEGEKNYVDQYALEYRITVNHDLTVIRRTLTELADECTMNDDGVLFVGEHEIALVYFRSGYDPKHYPSENEWSVRELIECSRSVKVPSVLGQLAGTKKVQQLWFEDQGSHLRRFGLSETEVHSMMSVFAVQADPAIDEQTRERAIEQPDAWILKPQREGGGHNLHGDDLKIALQTLSPGELSQYVLMERMLPEPSPALVIDSAATMEAGNIVPMVIPEAVCELGIFSYFLPQLNVNETCGHLIRTKDKDTREGGVNMGYAYLDTLFLK